MDRTTLEKWISGYGSAFREAHQFAAESQAQSDQILAWTVGLMGAGLFAAPTFLSSVGIGLSGRRAVIGVLSPWIIGILIGVIGRVLAVEQKEANNLFFAGKIQDIETLLFKEEHTVEALTEQFVSIMKDEGPHKPRLAKVKTLRRWTLIAYHATYVALGVGVIT